MAEHVYLVIGGTGSVGVTFDDKRRADVPVNGIPKLYTLYSSTTPSSGVLKLTFSRGLEAYDFTFG
jgi:hypothetical protein